MSEESGMYQSLQTGKRRKKWIEDKIKEAEDIIHMLQEDLSYYEGLLEGE